ncbi:SH3 domain-containing protein [Paraburkholderia caribensis]|uniref:SH3 domain-containing protein n=1 Tax=Paraburkholderia caribensis TaxID=75105 RepID=UPI00159034D2|nr:SH3 domain-containing protein [Paraburkholderia caribensis]
MSESVHVLKGMWAMEEAAIMKTARMLEDSPIMKTARMLEDSPIMKTARMLEDSPIMKSMRMLEDSPIMKTARMLADSPIMKSMRMLEDSPIMKTARTLEASSLAESVSSATAMHGLPRLSALGTTMQIVQNSPLFHWISSADSSRLEALLDAATDTSQSTASAVTETSVDGKFSFDDAAVELQEALTGRGQVKPLSASAQYWLFKMLMLLWCVYQAIAQWPDFQSGLCDLQTRLMSAESRRELRKLTRGFVCELPPDVMKSLRYTDDDGVNLYQRPAVRSQVIETLPKGVVLAILDETDRNWLYVHIELDGVDSEGWVSRKFTRRFTQ